MYKRSHHIPRRRVLRRHRPYRPKKKPTMVSAVPKQVTKTKKKTKKKKRKLKKRCSHLGAVFTGSGHRMDEQKTIIAQCLRLKDMLNTYNANEVRKKPISKGDDSGVKAVSNTNDKAAQRILSKSGNDPSPVITGPKKGRDKTHSKEDIASTQNNAEVSI